MIHVTTMRRACGVALAAALLAAGCDRDGKRDVNVDLDSAGSKLERGVEKVGEKLDTAWTGVKTELNETKIEGMLGQINGLDSVDAQLTPEGDVTLTGSVATEERRAFAEQMTRGMKGVRSVTNKIAIGAGGTVSDSTIADTTGNTKHPAKP